MKHRNISTKQESARQSYAFMREKPPVKRGGFTAEAATRALILKALAILILFLATGISAQELPDEIRGYKVHKAKISVTNSKDKIEEKDRSEAYVRMSDPVLTDKSFSGITFEITGEIDSLEHSGKVDFLMFRDFTVNGLAVDIEEYRESFEFKKNSLIILPKPIKIFVNSAQTLRGALGEIRDSKEEWDVTGKVFVFGKFKKLGFNFKRVVPVDVNIRIKNPIKKEKILPDIIPQID